MEYLIKRGTLYQRRRDGTFSDALAKIQNTLDVYKRQDLAVLVACIYQASQILIGQILLRKPCLHSRR